MANLLKYGNIAEGAPYSPVRLVAQIIDAAQFVQRVTAASELAGAQKISPDDLLAIMSEIIVTASYLRARYIDSGKMGE